MFQLYKSKPLDCAEALVLVSAVFVVKTLAIEFAIINIFLVIFSFIRKRYNITVYFPPRYLLRRLPIHCVTGAVSTHDVMYTGFYF